MSDEFHIGDKVYRKREKLDRWWPGIVVMKGTTLAGHVRYVIESVTPGTQGTLHVMSASQMKLGDNNWPDVDVTVA